ncbi:MAG: MG2 domain-containing protein [Gemmatimonadota bacterium]|nr:MG2 domain-containing protein [Gemmatimonadota bacterium]
MSYRISLLAFLTLFACSQKSLEDAPQSYPLETARMVSHVSGGVLASTDPIRVRFVSPVVGKSQVGQVLRTRVFRFVPSIDGLATWEDVRTLVFKPNAPLTLRTVYSGELSMADLFPQHKDLKPLVIQFEVAGRELVALEADFELPDANDPQRLVFSGQISFNERADSSAVSDAVVLRLGDQQLALHWRVLSDGKTHDFTSAVITRTGESQELAMHIDRADLDLSQDYDNTWSLPPLSALSVMEIEKHADRDRPSVSIIFSDDLDFGQDIAGLITADPPQQLQLNAIGKTVSVVGDFQHGQRYVLTVHSGVRSRWGVALAQPHTETVVFDDIKPRMRFARDGVFLPSSGNRKIRFQTVNVSRVHLKIQKVFESNLGQFLQDQRVDGSRDRTRVFSSYQIRRVGVTVADTTLDIGNQKNVWLQHELDLDNLISKEEKGLYLIGLTFAAEDMLYGDPVEAAEARQQRRRYRGTDYYNNPYSRGYVYQHGRIYKPVVVSDIGLTHQKTHDRHLVYATHLEDARPLPGVTITLRTYQNQIMEQKVTDRNGLADFSPVKSDVFYIEAEKDGQRSFIKPGDMAWNLSTFDTGGRDPAPDGIRAFFYAERGVYRPGDDIHLSAIVRNHNHTFPDGHPISLAFFNPLGQRVLTQTNREGKDGFYTFDLSTSADAPTGNWRAKIDVGSRKFNHRVKVETIVPFRLKVFLDPQLAERDRVLKADLRSAYLFGNPAAGLKSSVDVTLRSSPPVFPNFKGFSFVNQAVNFKPITTNIFTGALDEEGKAAVSWGLPSLNEAPSRLSANLRARVLEKGGRPNSTARMVHVDPFDVYVGLRKPDLDYGFTRVNASLEVPVVAVTPDGEAVPGRTLMYRVFHNENYWWWEYDSRDQFRLRFKRDFSTEKIFETSIISRDRPVPVAFTPEKQGEYLVEVADANGHKASLFIRAYPWGSLPASGRVAGALVLKTDRENYAPGEKAVVSFPVPDTSSVLVTVSRGGNVVHSRWHTPRTRNTTQVEIPITADMAPNAYVTISVIQPHRQTANDRPLRMYGVVPLRVADPDTRLDLTLTAPDELKPEDSFEVVVQTGDGKPAQLTLAVVDEGLLDITQFSTPDPWRAFFGKLRLGLHISDLFGQVIGVNIGDVFKTFAIGGDAALAAYRRDRLPEEQKQRFKSVSLFEGPVATDDQGRAVVSFTLPNYVGSVRIMAVAARGNAYGSVEKTVPVKTDLMVLPTLPRVLRPGDRIAVPATVFAMRDSLGSVEVAISTEGLLNVDGQARDTIAFREADEEDILFMCVVPNAIGDARVAITATAGDVIATHTTDLTISPSSPRISADETREIRPGQAVVLPVPDRGIPGSNRARLTLHTRPNMKLGNRLLWLVRYPYGCVEQVVSAAFPQLYLKDILIVSGKSNEIAREIDDHINAAIRRLRRFQLPSGALSYWPGRSKPSIWGTLYAGHFLIEANALGYHVPDDLFESWVQYEQSRALTTRDDLMIRTYRVYLLALANQPALGAMNLLKESSLRDMADVEKWLLASAYRRAGSSAIANEILRNAGTLANRAERWEHTFGSALRDRAMILGAMIDFQRWGEADPLVDEIALALSSDRWYSTQTSGFALLALGKHIRATEGDQPLRLTGSVTLPGGEVMPFDSGSRFYNVDIESGFGQSVRVQLNPESTVTRAFATLEWSGVPLVADSVAESHSLELDVRWRDDDGFPVYPDTLKQGATFWGHFSVKNTSVAHIREIALTQLLPSGWEIENTRLSGALMPGWASNLGLGSEAYFDMRDDRVTYFFDIAPESKTQNFVVKLNAVTAGTFTLPPTLVEAMYNNKIKAVVPGRTIVVK